MLNGHHHALNGSSHHDASHRLRREAKRALKKTGFTSRQILCFLGVVVTVVQMFFAAKMADERHVRRRRRLRRLDD